MYWDSYSPYLDKSAEYNGGYDGVEECPRDGRYHGDAALRVHHLISAGSL